MVMIFNGFVVTLSTLERSGGFHAPHDNLSRHSVACQYLVGIILPVFFLVFMYFRASIFFLAVIPLGFLVCQFTLLCLRIFLIGSFMSIALIDCSLTFFAVPIQSVFSRAVYMKIRPRLLLLTSGASF